MTYYYALLQHSLLPIITIFVITLLLHHYHSITIIASFIMNITFCVIALLLHHYYLGQRYV